MNAPEEELTLASIADMIADESHPLHGDAMMAKRIGQILEQAGIGPGAAIGGIILLAQAIPATALAKMLSLENFVQ